MYECKELIHLCNENPFIPIKIAQTVINIVINNIVIDKSFKVIKVLCSFFVFAFLIKIWIFDVFNNREWNKKAFSFLFSLFNFLMYCYFFQCIIISYILSF